LVERLPLLKKEVMRIGLLWCALVLSVTVLQAQHLKRSGTLGIYPAALSATEALKAGMDAPKGIKVAKVMPGSTAEAIGIAEGDLVLEVNGEAVESPAGIVAQLGELSAGEEVVLTTIRDGRKLTQTGPMGARPLPLAPGATIDFGEVPYGGGHLRSFLEKPQGDGPFPVIYFLQGYTCQTVEHGSPHSPMRKLFNQWVSNGYAVFRVEKPGVGDSAGTPDCESIDFDAELLAFKAGYKALLKRDGIDTEQLFETTLEALPLDFDQDGDTDLILTQWSVPGSRAYQVLLNDGNAKFTVAPESVLPQANFTQGTGVHANDFNGDGIADLYLANYNQQDYLFFSELASAIGTTGGNAEADFQVFPNPVQEVLHFAAGSPGQVQVFDAAGQLKWAGHIGQTGQLDVSRWASGTYWARYHTNAGAIEPRSFVKE
jgi:hypothetical protein